MAQDNSPKAFVVGGKVPKDGDLAIFNETLGGWIAVSASDLLDTLIADQSFTDAVQAVIDAQ